MPPRAVRSKRHAAEARPLTQRSFGTQTEPARASLPPWLLPALALVFFLSGISGLVYQSLWQRLLSLVFGVTVYATSTVLASFMAGLALGSLVAGRLADRVRRPLVWFGVTEVLIGVTALGTPLALDAVTAVYVALHAAVPDAIAPLTLARFACSFVVLLVPTALMGATLPLVVKSSLGRGALLGPRVGVLYASNTAGAIIGALSAGYLLIGGIGIGRTFVLAATLNVLVGLAALAMSRAMVEAAGEPQLAVPEPVPAAAEQVTERERRLILVVFGLSGLAALALEVIWFRVLVLFLPATTYAFTTMLAAVLLGIALGSALATPLLGRARDWSLLLATTQALTGIVALLSLGLLMTLYHDGNVRGASVPVSLVAILPAALMMGVSFPIGVRAWAGDGRRDAAHTAERVGLLYAVNLGGAIAGAVLGGFLLLPWLGSRRALVVVATIYVTSGLLLLLVRAQRRGWRAMGVLGLPAVVVFAALASWLPEPIAAVEGRRVPHGERLLWHEEGTQTTVGVYGRPLGGTVLYLDGLHQANDTAPMVKLHRQIGVLPMALHPRPSRALVIGLGGGVTPGAVSLFGGTTVDIVELSDSVVHAASWFSHVNHDVLARPNVRLRVDDGRNFLLMTPQRYDVVTADIIQPVHAGAGNLYSREYFALARQVIDDGGLMLQWVGERPASQYRLIVRTFLDAFPETTLWVAGNLLVGSTRPLEVSRSAFDARLADPGTRQALAEIDVRSFDDLLALYTAGPEELRTFIGPGPLLTDDRPLVEYHRSLPADEPTIDLSPLRGDVTRHVRE